MNALKEQYDNLISEYQRVRTEFQTKAQAVFREMTKELFDANPGIKAIVWTQYTPYFNDGDTCEFRVNDLYFTNAEGEDLDDVSAWGDYEGDNEDVRVFSTWEMKKNQFSGVDSKVANEFESMFNSNEMQDILEEMFGDHVQVVGTRDGFSVTEYEHD